MAIVWSKIGPEIKRRRRLRRMTQDMLAAKVGVRWNTVARLESGNRRPSLDLLEKLAAALRCRIHDLLPEEDHPVELDTERREPSLAGTPSYFRYGITDATARKIVGVDPTTGRAVRADWSMPGWHLAIHLGEYVTDDDAREELEQLETDATGPRDFARRLTTFLELEFPGCMALIPTRRREQFLQGVYAAIDQGRTPIRFDVSDLLKTNREA
jgi:DNA-binding XRE family transcriptional regulator